MKYLLVAVEDEDLDYVAGDLESNYPGVVGVKQVVLDQIEFQDAEAVR